MDLSTSGFNMAGFPQDHGKSFQMDVRLVALCKPVLTSIPFFLSDRSETFHEVHQPGVQPEEDAIAETHGCVWSQDHHSDQVS